MTKTRSFAICIIILLFITFLSIITGNNFITTTIDASYSFEQIVNGTTSDIAQEYVSILQLDAVYDALGWIGIIGAIAVGSGITILACGLNEVATHWLVYLTFFTSLWIILTILPYPLIIGIQFFGVVIYLIMTIIYAISVILWIGETS